jgi:hypothetical protein
MSLLILWLLGTLDAAFVGYREASGRSGLVRKSAYYAQAMRRAALVGQVALGATGLLAAGWLLFAAEPDVLAAGYRHAASSMLYALVPYAVVVLGALAVRQVPVVDVQALMNVTILGPFTALRPIALVGGALLAVTAEPRFEIAILCAMGLGCAFGLGPFLTWLRHGKLVVD